MTYALGIKYQAVSSTNTLPTDWVGVFSNGTDTLKFTDMSEGDGLSNSNFTAETYNGFLGEIIGCYDLGSIVYVSKLEAVLQNKTVDGSVYNYISNDFKNWVLQSVTGTGTPPAGIVNMINTTMRYCMIIFEGTSPGISDYRLYDAYNNQILTANIIPNSPRHKFLRR